MLRPRPPFSSFYFNNGGKFQQTWAAYRSLRQVLRQRQSKSNPLYSSSIGCLTLQHA
jgi:hypothetical protein